MRHDELLVKLFDVFLDAEYLNAECATNLNKVIE